MKVLMCPLLIDSHNGLVFCILNKAVVTDEISSTLQQHKEQMLSFPRPEALLC